MSKRAGPGLDVKGIVEKFVTKKTDAGIESREHELIKTYKVAAAWVAEEWSHLCQWQGSYGMEERNKAVGTADF